MIVVLPVPFLLPSPPKSKLLPSTSVSPLLVKRTAWVTLPTLIKFLTVKSLIVIIGYYICPLAVSYLSFRCPQHLSYYTLFDQHFQLQCHLQLASPVHVLLF